MARKIQKKISEKELNNALYKKAMGYETNEIVEEYVVSEDGGYVLNKKNVTKKYVAPDLQTAKMLLDKLNDVEDLTYRNFSEQELLEEKLKLLKILEEK